MSVFLKNISRGIVIVLLDSIKKIAHFLFSLTVPKSQNEDLRRREFILNVLLLAIIFLSLFATLRIAINIIKLGALYRGESFILEIIILGLFLFLHLLSRKGYFIVVSYIFLGLIFIPLVYSNYKWGIDLPQILLIYVLLIIIAGILLNSKSALFISILSFFIIVLLGHFQNSGIITPNLYWKKEMLKTEDAIIFGVTFFIFFIVSWLSNRELEKSLHRARQAERDLQTERDQLEIKVIERTRQLEAEQAKNMLQFHRFAEFGKLAGGIIHDMATPLTTAIMAIEKIKKQNQHQEINLPDLKYLENSTIKMRSLIESVGKQLGDQEIHKKFNPEKEIKSAIETLSYKARSRQVSIYFYPPQNQKSICISGNPVKLYRVICDILSNAIDAYDNKDREENQKHIEVTLKTKNTDSIITIKDYGSGIKDEYQGQIFKILFTTKEYGKGLGLGLAVSKEIIEKEFGGKIDFSSKENLGSIFTISIPLAK